MKPISYGRQSITEEDIRAVVAALQSDYLTQGPCIDAFEKAFARYVGAEYAVFVSNGTAALHLSALALGVQPGDKVIVPSLTFAASANCIRFCWGEVTFCDINGRAYLMDLKHLKSLLAQVPKGTYKGIVPVDFAGYPIDAEAFRKLADEYGLWIIEDACHAPGASFTDSTGVMQAVGNGKFSDLTIFSFHPVKHITTGEGGMITTNRKDLYDKLILHRTHGITRDKEKMTRCDGGWYMEMLELGYNYRATDFQAALGIAQLKRAKAGVERRQQLAKQYDRAFSSCDLIVAPQVLPAVSHAYHLYVIQVENRLGLYNYLREQSIYAQVHYIPLHLMPYYRQFGNKEGDLPVVEAYYQHCISLPMYPTLTDEEQQYVIDHILAFVTGK